VSDQEKSVFGSRRAAGAARSAWIVYFVVIVRKRTDRRRISTKLCVLSRAMEYEAGNNKNMFSGPEGPGSDESDYLVGISSKLLELCRIAIEVCAFLNRPKYGFAGQRFRSWGECVDRSFSGRHGTR